MLSTTAFTCNASVGREQRQKDPEILLNSQPSPKDNLPIQRTMVYFRNIGTTMSSENIETRVKIWLNGKAAIGKELGLIPITTWCLTIPCNSNSRPSNALHYSPYACSYTNTHTHRVHIYTNKYT